MSGCDSPAVSIARRPRSCGCALEVQPPAVLQDPSVLRRLAQRLHRLLSKAEKLLPRRLSVLLGRAKGLGSGHEETLAAAGERGRVSMEVWSSVVGAGMLDAPAGVTGCEQGGCGGAGALGLCPVLRRGHATRGPSSHATSGSQLTVFSLREQGTMDSRGIANITALNFVTWSTKISSLFLKVGGECKKEGKTLKM